ncbi:hypothetical protein R5R35_011600 [Gryllus longicercus]|uniref:Accessory gland protein n=1 Tax=Gryllus longicercus TaxID=2509291 RepID=A0AAN9Z602_9ORTH
MEVTRLYAVVLSLCLPLVWVAGAREGTPTVSKVLVKKLKGNWRSKKLKKKLKKSKLRKILVPVAVLLLLKALTVVPLVLGILGVKAWNALQLSFGSFVVSLALAVFQLCQKLARDSPPPPQLVASHPGGWDASARAAPADDLAFRAYAP